MLFWMIYCRKQHFSELSRCKDDLMAKSSPSIRSEGFWQEMSRLRLESTGHERKWWMLEEALEDQKMARNASRLALGTSSTWTVEGFRCNLKPWSEFWQKTTCDARWLAHGMSGGHAKWPIFQWTARQGEGCLVASQPTVGGEEKRSAHAMRGLTRAASSAFQDSFLGHFLWPIKGKGGREKADLVTHIHTRKSLSLSPKTLSSSPLLSPLSLHTPP